MGAFGERLRAIVERVGRLGASLIPEIPLWNQLARIGGGISPGTVSNILREADAGKPARLVDLVHECRQKDGHIQAVLGVRELAIAGLEWTIDPPADADQREKDCAAQCEAAIRASRGFHVLLAHLTGEGCLHPVGAWAETVWKIETQGVLRGLEVPDHFTPISSRRFGFKRSNGQVVFVEYGHDPETSGIDLFEEYDQGNFIAYRPRVNGDVPAREGLDGVIIWAAIFRNWAIRDWLSAGELSWKPWRLAFYDKAIDEKSRDFAEEAIQTITATGAAVLPKTVDLKVEWPKATGSSLQGVHSEITGFFGSEISKAVLGQTLTTEAGFRGARSLGQVHDNIRRDIREADAVGIAACLDQYLVGPFYAFNYGDGVRRGSFRFQTEDGVDMTALAEVINKLADKVAIPQAWVRDQLGVPAPTDEDELCGSGGKAEEPPDDSNSTDEPEDDEDIDDAA